MRLKISYDEKAGVLRGDIIDKQTRKVCVEKGQQIKWEKIPVFLYPRKKR